MKNELTPAMQEGEDFTRRIEKLIPFLREQAAIADQNNTMSEASFDSLQSVGIPSAFVPKELGGLGIEKIQDWLAGIAMLARGDGSVAIAINMHWGVSRGMVQGWRAATGQGKNAEIPAKSLKSIVCGDMLICATATERGTDNLHPMTTAVRNEHGWLINGHKMFVTMSPIATHLAMNLRMQDDDGDHLATTMLPITTAGVIQQGDWDALGMRGSGSQSIKLEDVQVGAHAVRPLGPWGKWSTSSLINRTFGNLALVAAFFGIAHHAREIALEAAAGQLRLGEPVTKSPGFQQTAGELEIEFNTCRSTLQQIGIEIDEWLIEAARTPPTIESAHQLMQRYQSVKWVVNHGAIGIVDKAMHLAGGGGFMSGNSLSRLYRDVRAGPFMQPHAATDIRQYVGQVMLGEYPHN